MMIRIILNNLFVTGQIEAHSNMETISNCVFNKILAILLLALILKQRLYIQISYV
jgi:hypothetical protein